MDSEQKIIERIESYYEENQEPPRPHMGLSQVGHHCDRYLWLNFRWAHVEKFSGRVLRLFQRGHDEEKKIVKLLKRAGLVIEFAGHLQFKVDFGSHVSGSLDGIIKYGVPGDVMSRYILEVKTHNTKSFSKLKKEGVKESKPMHYRQVQSYMLGSKIDRCLYVAICKDNDELYIETIMLNAESAQIGVNKMKSIAMSEYLPPKISESSSWFECKMCSMHEFCHKTKLTKEVNCRTCEHSKPQKDSTFFCSKHNDVIPVDFQYRGCDYHSIHKDLTPWETVPSDIDHHNTFMIDGNEVLNGKRGFSSHEIIANPGACFKNDRFTQDLRKNFEARVTG